MTMVACTQSPVQLPAFYEAGTSDATIYEASAPDGESQGGDAGDAGAKKDGAAEDGGDAKAPMPNPANSRGAVLLTRSMQQGPRQAMITRP